VAILNVVTAGAKLAQEKGANNLKDLNNTMRDMYPKEWDTYYNEYNTQNTPDVDKATEYADMRVLLSHNEVAKNNQQRKGTYKFLNNYIAPFSK